MDILEKFHGHTGKTPWTFSMHSLEIVQCFRSNTPAGQCPWIPWTFSTGSMDFLQTGNEQGFDQSFATAVRGKTCGLYMQKGS